MKMRDLDRLEIEAYVEHARRMRSEACGELLAAGWNAVRRQLTLLARRLAASVPHLPAAH
jgi:hypothetical protein